MFDGASSVGRRFGSFALSPRRRLLLDRGQPVRIGSRALELLIVLTERAGELVTKEELTARLWPATTVVEANLTVQTAALRRALRDGRDGNRYIVNEPGRGYRFVAPVITADEPLLMADSPTRSVWPDDASVLRVLEAGCWNDAAQASAADQGIDEPDTHKALLDNILQRGILALELARTLLAVDPASRAIDQVSDSEGMMRRAMATAFGSASLSRLAPRYVETSHAELSN
jgi:DNA-binding winged helix-turn-helix (wHTH) protein